MSETQRVNTDAVSKTATPLGERYGEPWRYRCLQCGSVSVFKRFHNWQDGRGAVRCDGCQTVADRMWDAKSEQEVTLREVEV